MHPPADAADYLTDDEVAAVHEAAHAVVAVFGRWTKLAGPVALDCGGCGDVVMSTNVEAIRRTLLSDPGFDRHLPRIELIGALLAGPIAERMLRERGRAALSERELSDTSRGDYDVVAEQLAMIDPPRPGLQVQIEREVRQRLEQPATWTAIERFAAILLERRRLEAEEATAILTELQPAEDMEGAPAAKGRRTLSVTTLVVLAALALAAILRLLG